MKPNERIKECLDFNLRCAARAPGERLMSNCINYFRRKILLALFSISALLLSCLFVIPFASAEETVASQRVFASPEAASSALVSASKAYDRAR
jgi:hypothetical protein